MKNLKFIIIVLLYCVTHALSQEEYEIYPNGLIYSEETMNKLKHIADSLNLKCKSFDSNKIFYSKGQTIAHAIIIEKNDIKKAKRIIKKHIKFEEFIKKFPKAIVEYNAIILKGKYKNRESKNIVVFNEFNIKSDYSLKIIFEDTTVYNIDVTNKWIWQERELEEILVAFYFPTNFTSIPIPKKYSEMIAYADCITDTTTKIFHDNSKEGWVELPENWKNLSYEDKLNLLEQMRSTIVTAFCSMDDSPRLHALHIALLSAEVANWGVFIKSHLDIMNDYFDRLIDASYGWERRKTYIKELEELNIDVIKLLLGISFSIENPASNHYFGNIARIGMAFTESIYRQEFENEVLSIISDKNLDLHNRLKFYFLFLNYIYHLKDDKLKEENTKKLEMAKKTFPDFIIEKLNEKDNDENEE